MTVIKTTTFILFIQYRSKKKNYIFYSFSILSYYSVKKQVVAIKYNQLLMETQKTGSEESILSTSIVTSFPTASILLHKLKHAGNVQKKNVLVSLHFTCDSSFSVQHDSIFYADKMHKSFSLSNLKLILYSYFLLFHCWRMHFLHQSLRKQVMFYFFLSF